MSDMSNLYRAYSAVHNVEIKEELQQNRDLISEMNMSQVLQSDLVEVCEEIVEGLFQYGLDLDSVSGVISTLLEKVREGSSNELKEGKIDQIAEAFGTVVDTVTDKAERNCEEEFLLYRQNKPLTEKWNNKVSHEVGNAKLHASLIHEDRHQIKFGLIEMISELIVKEDYYDPMDDDNFDPIKAEKNRGVSGKNNPKGGKKTSLKKLAKMIKKEDVSTLRQDWGDAYSSVYGDKETISEKGMNPGFKAYLEKQKTKKGKDGDEKEGKSEGGGKPDFLDLDKDGDKKEPMKKAAKEKKEEVSFSETELAKIQEIVDSWED